MRVLHVVRQFAPSIGGIEEVVLNLARRQRDDFGIDAQVVTLDSLFTDRNVRLPAQAEVGGVPVHRIRWWGSTRYPLAPVVFRHVLQADIVHVHAIDFFVDFLAATRLFHRRPMVVMTHGGIFHTARQARLKRLWFRTVTRLSLRAYQAVIACSENDASLFAQLRPKRLVAIENGIDASKLRGASAAAPEPHRILAIGRFAPHKRMAALFPLLAALHRCNPDWTLVIAGVEWGVTAQDLRAAADGAGVADAVRILVGASDATLANEAAAATWFTSASAFEGFGVAALEGVAAGLIPILSRIPTFERLAASLPASVLFDPDAPEAAAAAIAVQDRACEGCGPQLREQLARCADRHDWSHVAGHHVALYASILQRPAVSAAPAPA